MKVSRSLFVASLFASLFVPSIAAADVISFEYGEARCEEGEVKVECHFKYDHPGGDIIEDGCQAYAADPAYRLLASGGGTLGGSRKYCFRAGADAVDSPEQGTDEHEQEAQIVPSLNEDEVAKEVISDRADVQVRQQVEEAARRESRLLGIAGVSIVAAAIVALIALTRIKAKEAGREMGEKGDRDLSADKNDRI